MFALTGDAPEAAGLFAHAATLLGDDPRELVRGEGLHRNRTGQILCSLQALAAAAALRLDGDLVVAGYSVGEMAAWGVAGLFRMTDALDLTARRAEAMDAVARPDEGMLFVRGLSQAALETLHGAAIAIVEPDEAFILGGTRAALDALAGEARAMGAVRVVDVPVHVASHTPHLAPAAAKFREILRAVPVNRPGGMRLLSGIDGLPVLDADAGLDKLARQIAHTVRWDACLQGCIEAGATAFFELGPGPALSKMAAATYREVPARCLEDFRTLDGARAWVARHDR